MTVRARAPGKLFLTGEWAVLRVRPRSSRPSTVTSRS